jgi:hypothetical protein
MGSRNEDTEKKAQKTMHGVSERRAKMVETANGIVTRGSIKREMANQKSAVGFAGPFEYLPQKKQRARAFTSG